LRPRLIPDPEGALHLFLFENHGLGCGKKLKVMVLKKPKETQNLQRAEMQPQESKTKHISG